MAPHIEKAQLISKPTTRRGSSKSPSKPAKDNSNEMPQPNQERTTPPKKLSGELPKFLVPGRKISAPECNRPPVSRGARRNMFAERCISQEEKQKSKEKTSMRKFSTPAISLSNGTEKTGKENDDSNSKIETPKTVLPVYEICTPENNRNKEMCQINKPQIQVSVPKTPVNRRKKPIIDIKEKEKALLEKEAEAPTRKTSVPMFHVSQEGTNNTSKRNLYKERCISTEEKEQIKTKPISKKPPKEPLTPPRKSSDEEKFTEKVKLKPKSEQRKLSAPAKMITPATPPTVNSIDLLAEGVVLDGRGGGIQFENPPNLRDEDGKPSFTKAAKVIHARVQVVSCFRSSGAMPIPKVTPKIKAPPPRPKPRKLELPSTHEAKEIDLDIEMETTEELPEFEYWDEHLTETVVPRLTRCMIIPHPKIIDIINGFRGINEDVILRNRGSKIHKPLPPPSEYMTSKCEKHSRCHCNLLSKNVNDFFSVTPQ